MNADPDPSADLIVVGAGMAGFCCALEAAAHGAQVILLEKQPAVGGSSILSGGSFAFAGTDRQREAGIHDSADRMVGDLRRVGGNRNDPVLLEAFAAEQLDTYHWLQGFGMQFGRPQVAAGQSVPRTHHSDQHAMFDRLAEAVERAPRIRLATGIAARRLIREGGAVAGLHAECGDRAQILHAKGVVLTTGGFMRNEALLENFAPSQASALRMGGAGCTGDGLRMAWQLGADLRDMGTIKGSFGIHASAGPEDHFILLSLYMGGIAVNRLGMRFIDESLSYKLIGDACLKQPEALGFQIFDRTVMDRSVPDGSSFDLAAEGRAGRLLQADSLAALAEMLGIAGAGLAATIRRYNADADRGIEGDFGRRSLSSGWGALTRIEMPPFYGYATKSAIVGTYCGLVLDRAMRVLDVFGAPIPGLYAAGQVMGGFHGTAYMTGTALSKAAVFGRLAGRAAARAGA